MGKERRGDDSEIIKVSILTAYVSYQVHQPSK